MMNLHATMLVCFTMESQHQILGWKKYATFLLNFGPLIKRKPPCVSAP